MSATLPLVTAQVADITDAELFPEFAEARRHARLLKTQIDAALAGEKGSLQ